MALRSAWTRALVVLVAFVAAMAVAPRAAAMTPEELVKAVEAKYKDVTTIEAKVKQTTRNELFGDETVEGKLTVKRPYKLRWEAGATLFVSDGQKMWIYTAEDKQVIEYDDVSAKGDGAQQLLTSMDRLDEQFAVEVPKSDDTGHVVVLKPKVDDGSFKSVRMTLDPKLMLEEVVITDAFDNVTVMAMSEVELNGSVPDSLFTFTTPAGVDVIKAN